VIIITKEEAAYLRKIIKDVRIVKTCNRNSKRGKRYAEESKAVIDALVDYRSKRNILQ
jgi:hypothetical protein